MEDGLMDHNVTITKESILLSKKGTKRLCTKLYKERLLFGLQYIPMAGQGIIDPRRGMNLSDTFNAFLRDMAQVF